MMPRRIRRAVTYALYLGVGALLVAAPALAAEAGSAGAHEPKLEWNIIGWKALNFAILMAALVYVLKKPIAEFFGSRRAQIQKDLDEARQARDEARATLAEVEAKLSKAEAETEAMLAKAEEEATAEREQILKSAEAEAVRIRELAREEVSRATDQARQELRAYAAELAVEQARELLVAEMKDADRQALIDEYVQSIEGRLAS